jgi:glycosyltransferase involved in cell wall biosynthesis
MQYGRVYGRIMLLFHILSVRRIDSVIGVSFAVTENLKKKFLIKNTLTIQNGVDTDIFSTDKSCQSKGLRLMHSIPLKSNVWICSGPLLARKDPLFLIKAWKTLYRSNQTMYLVLIGDGVLMDACRKEAKAEDNILILGGVGVVSDYLKMADYYVSASKAEGLPNAALEAIACGLPTVLSDIEPHKELSKTLNEVSSIFKIGNIESLKKSVSSILHKDKLKLSLIARKVAVERFGAKKMSLDYQKIYNQKVK